uniref:Uncharacterized protein n=1 Tax=Phlebotomus papatasi TaxID=29031 RepID=A0A1B0DNA9_PHLPP
MAINLASKSLFNNLWILLNVLLVVLDSRVYGHVALTFPPARKYDLDFLDNSRTKGPCGMPKVPRRRRMLMLCNQFSCLKQCNGYRCEYVNGDAICCGLSIAEEKFLDKFLEKVSIEYE